jgi:hypothetical protein
MRVGAEGRERQAQEMRASADRDTTSCGCMHARETERRGPHVKQAQACGWAHGQAQLARASERPDEMSGR